MLFILYLECLITIVKFLSSIFIFQMHFHPLKLTSQICITGVSVLMKMIVSNKGEYCKINQD